MTTQLCTVLLERITRFDRIKYKLIYQYINTLHPFLGLNMHCRLLRCSAQSHHTLSLIVVTHILYEPFKVQPVDGRKAQRAASAKEI